MIREWIGHHIQRVRIVEATHCDVPLDVLLAVGRFHGVNEVAQPEYDNGGHHQEHDGNNRMFETWSYESCRPMSLEALREMVQRKLPVSVYRCKGIVFAADSPDKRLALQVVGRRTEISELDGWGERTPRTQVVAIGSSIDAEDLKIKFDACLAKVRVALS